jgi:hypothetical protein
VGAAGHRHPVPRALAAARAAQRGRSRRGRRGAAEAPAGERQLWLAEHDIDWALAGEAVLLHDPGLREFQLKELRAFVDAERLANYERLNHAYRLPAAGQPIERV